jgi:hypothetical protein
MSQESTQYKSSLIDRLIIGGIIATAIALAVYVVHVCVSMPS